MIGMHETVICSESASIGVGLSMGPFGVIHAEARIGDRCVFGQSVMIGSRVVIGNGCKIQNNVSVYEGVHLEDYVFCGPSMVFTNIKNPRCEFPQADTQYYIKTVVRRGASIGANATIVCGVTIGRYACIGAGAVVVDDVPDYAIVVGNPGRPIGWMSAGGIRMVFDADGYFVCPKSEERYHQQGDRVVRIAS